MTTADERRIAVADHYWRTHATALDDLTALVESWLAAERKATADRIAARLLTEAQPHDARGFSAVGDAYAAAARIARAEGGAT